MQNTEDSKSRQVYVSALGKNLLREAFLGNTDFTYKQQQIFNPTNSQSQVIFTIFTIENRMSMIFYILFPQRKFNLILHFLLLMMPSNPDILPANLSKKFLIILKF